MVNNLKKLKIETYSHNQITRHLDLGCGGTPRNPFNASELHGVDIKDRLSCKGGGIIFKKANLVLDAIPYQDDYFDSVSAYDFIEHIPRLIIKDGETYLPFINLMNEVYRVLRHNGTFYAVTPFYPKSSAFVDPTHVNFIASDTYKYFVKPHLWASVYGFDGVFECRRAAVVNFSNEIAPQKGVKSALRSLFYSLFPLGKQHLAWRFVAIKI